MNKQLQLIVSTGVINFPCTKDDAGFDLLIKEAPGLGYSIFYE